MAKRIYFIGIGGISMSALAVFLSIKGNTVCGSDFSNGENLKALKDFQIECYIGHNKENIKKFNPNLVVINSAIKEENEELSWAVSHKKKILTRAEVLGLISKDFNNVIAISGTHGKTTTTALISEIFMEANLKPTVHVGGILKKSGSNFLIGEKKFFITEACEYKNSFLSLNPSLGVVLNIESDHLDFFKNLSEINKSFEKFLENSKTKLFKANEFEYVLQNSKAKHKFCAKNLYKNEKGFLFDFYEDNCLIGRIQTNFMGEHNVKNALVACSVARFYKIKISVIKKAIKNFHGVKRRFERITKLDNSVVIHDYAHHPTEIEKVIQQAKRYGKILTVFQPHTFSRTKKLFKSFLNCFNETDSLVLLKTYPAREKEIKSASAFALYNKIITENPLFNLKETDKLSYHKTCYYSETFEEAKNLITSISKEFGCILILGAGDINELAYMLKHIKLKYKQSN